MLNPNKEQKLSIVEHVNIFLVLGCFAFYGYMLSINDSVVQILSLIGMGLFAFIYPKLVSAMLIQRYWAGRMDELNHVMELEQEEISHVDIHNKV